MIIELPYPPSTNTYWRNVRGRVLISAKGRQYRKDVVQLCAINGKSLGDARIAVKIEAYMPDFRRRDLDNIFKASLDAMCHGGLYDDDSQIDALMVRRMAVDKDNPRIEVEIEVMESNA